MSAQKGQILFGPGNSQLSQRRVLFYGITSQMQGMASQVPEDFQFGLKVTHTVTINTCSVEARTQV
jgi:hypothetical protein